MTGFFDRLREEGTLLRRRWKLRAVLMHLVLIGVFGIFLPSWKGVDFLDSVILSAYACLGILFAAPASSEAFAGERPASFASALARITVAVMYAEIMTVTILLAALITVYSRTHFPAPPDLETLAWSAVFGAAAAFAMAALAGWLTMQFSPAAARGGLRLVFLGLLLLFFYRSRWLPDVAETGAVISLILAGGALFAIRRTFPRVS